MLKLKLSIFLPLILCWDHPMLNAFFFNSPISITGTKPWYSVGDSVDIYCKTTDEVYNDLYFSDLKPTFLLNNTNHSVRAVDKKTILLQLQNLSAGQYNYICQSEKTNISPLEIGVVSFKVGYPPEIKNIQFEYTDFEQLSVSLTPRVNDLDQYWKISWKLGENSTEVPISNECLCLNASQRCVCDDPFNCTISKESCFYPSRTYEFNILGSNNFGLFNKTYSMSPKPEIMTIKQLKMLETFSGDSFLSFSWKNQELLTSNVVEYKLQNGEWQIRVPC